ncbi:ABC transporter permease [Asaccharospora irregularis]|uniref:Putative ABC transport system permease protein n=1 Tax=Asaccharospora irregularis DSM 2635 TaxID=1121321 RepID=A0A1M5R4N7_9FIRM|nr:ABC transporter permease [Asaccharospora irregularis]SHH21355.1 putative ABC transport system permease protein [Asaccharospora irregularis DSM 2635]
MKLSFQIGVNYIKKYVTRSLTICLSLIICIALIIGISSLFESEKQADIAMTEYELGSHHVKFSNINEESLKKLLNNKNIKEIGLERYSDSNSEGNKTFNIIEADKNYLQFYNAEIIEGKMPKNNNEILLEPWVISSLNLPQNINQKINLKLYNNGKTKTKQFVIVGIIKDRVNNKANGRKEIITTFNNDSNKPQDVYIRFNDGVKINQNINSIKKELGIKKDNISLNRSLIESISNNVLTNNKLMVIIIVISIFACLIVYSIYSISTLQRLSEYGTLKSIGANKLQIFGIIFFELFTLYIISIPLGILLGIASANLCSSKITMMLSENTGVVNKIFISKESIILSIILMFINILIISISQIKKINKLSAIEAIRMNRGSSKKSNSSKMYSLGKQLSIINFISLKNILRDKRSFFITILSMSIGSTLFISSDFSSNLKNKNAELKLKSESSITSDYKISEESMDMKDGISVNQINQIKNLNGISSVEPFGYYCITMDINKKDVNFPHFYDEINKSPYVKDVLGGIFTKQSDSEDYKIKGSLYGYSDESLEKLRPYLKEGNIDKNIMKNSNIALLKIHRDGKGNPVFDFDIGDTIKIKFHKDTVIDEDDIKFPENIDYVEKEYVIGGFIEKGIVEQEYSVGDEGIEVILSDKVFKQSTNIQNYSIVNINKKGGYSSSKLNEQINNITKDTIGVILRDLSLEVKELNKYNDSRALLINGITVILFLVSVFNIINSISYNLISRTNEFSVIRAIGLSEKSFKKMILFEGIVYGIISNIVTIIFSVISQILIFIQIRADLINPKMVLNLKLYIIIIVLNMIIGMLATYIPSKRINNNSIVESMNKVE